MEISEDDNIFSKQYEDTYMANQAQSEVFQKPGDIHIRGIIKRDRQDSDIPYNLLSPQGGSFLLSPFYSAHVPVRKNSEDSLPGNAFHNEYVKLGRNFMGLSGVGDPAVVKSSGIDEEGSDIIDMENMIDEPNNFRLDRMGDNENEKRNNFYSTDKTPNPKKINSHRSQAIPAHEKFLKQSKGSLLNEIHGYIYSMVEKCDPNNYREYEQSLKLLKNLENWTFTEGTHSDENKFYQFTRYFIIRYEKLLKTIIECSEKTDFKSVLKHLWDFSIELHNDLLNFILACDENFCFNMLKNTSKIKNTKPSSINMIIHSKENTLLEGIKVVEPAMNMPIQSKLFARDQMSRMSSSLASENSNSTNDISMTSEKKQQSENASVNTKVKIENDSEGGSEGSEPKKNRRIWASQETAYIENLFISYSPDGIPQEKIEEFAKLYNRTIPSIKSKIQKCKKKLMKQDFDVNRNHNMNCLEGPIQSKMCHSGKYEIPLEKMLKIALSHFPEQKATKVELFAKVSEMFFRGNKSEESWKKSASQIIASCHNFTKIKGFYSLSEKAKSIQPNIKDLRSLSFKMKLLHVLKNLQENRGNIKSITEKYLYFFKDIEDIDINDPIKRKNLKNSILKTLNQNCEFDTQNSKTIYGLRNISKY